MSEPYGAPTAKSIADNSVRDVYRISVRSLLLAETSGQSREGKRT